MNRLSRQQGRPPTDEGTWPQGLVSPTVAGGPGRDQGGTRASRSRDRADRAKSELPGREAGRVGPRSHRSRCPELRADLAEVLVVQAWIIPEWTGFRGSAR